MNNLKFGDFEDKYRDLKTAKILLQPIPYDGTSTYGKGADKGFKAFMEASFNLENYDIETDSEPYKNGIHVLPELTEDHSPEEVFKVIRSKTKELLRQEKFLTFLGGEHSISIGIIEAFRQKYKNLTVLQLDAHSDLRKEYLGSEFNHACAMHLASQTTNLVQVGIRSMDISEKKYLKKDQCYFAHQIQGQDTWMQKSINQMTEDVYLTIDLDVFDPSIMPATGTPEPGGLDWYSTMRFLRKVFEQKNVVGFDIVEFAPIPNLHAADFFVAKLYYQLLAYKFKK